jgi:hypothetical protein
VTKESNSLEYRARGLRSHDIAWQGRPILRDLTAICAHKKAEATQTAPAHHCFLGRLLPPYRALQARRSMSCRLAFRALPPRRSVRCRQGVPCRRPGVPCLRQRCLRQRTERQ